MNIFEFFFHKQLNNYKTSEPVKVSSFRTKNISSGSSALAYSHISCLDANNSTTTSPNTDSYDDIARTLDRNSPYLSLSDANILGLSYYAERQALTQTRLKIMENEQLSVARYKGTSLKYNHYREEQVSRGWNRLTLTG
ncbi:unnamed protein product [Rhizophagus irregularis]|nr:unnamed protein product [Rhizophagus irregularis]CAB4431991.1 unnamed protein product [Rhizophagus irregularis]